MQGGQLPYEVRGEGPPLLLVPGTGFGAHTWGAFGERVASCRRVIAYDRRGFTTAAPEPAEDMSVHADDARSVLERAGAVPADVVGWSAGGLVALALAVEHPAICKTLLLIEPSVYGLRGITPSALGMTLRARAVRMARGQRAATDLSYRWTFAYRGRRRSAWDEMPEEWREHVLSHASAVAAEEAQEISLRYPPRDEVGALELPVTIVLGERSQAYFHRIARYLGRLILSARLHPVPEASHAVHLDAPDEVQSLLG